MTKQFVYYTPIDNMKTTLEQLVDKCKQISDNWHENENRYGWRNLRLVPEAANELAAMPLEGETSAKNQIEVFELMIGCVDELSIPRQVLGIRRHQLSLFAYVDPQEEIEVKKTDVEAEIKRLEDYLDLSIPMEEWCERYHKHLKFDPVERTQEWEETIYDAEEEVCDQLKDENRGMGFCFSYWAALRTALAKRGISWNSPSAMNPRVHFD